MGLFDFFKPRKPIMIHLINAKIKKGIEGLYVGQFISIEVDIGSNDNENYYFQMFENNQFTRISNKISSKYEYYFQEYKYGIIHSINNGIIEVAIICTNGYLKILPIEVNIQTNLGDAFIIKNSKLYSKHRLVGTIIDNKGLDLSKVRLNSINKEGKLVVFVKK